LTRSASSIFVLITALGLTRTSISVAEVQTVKIGYVGFGHGVPAVLYEPTNEGPKSQIALIVMHASGDYLNFSACTELAKRGYRVLCTNNSTSKSGVFDDGVLDKCWRSLSCRLISSRVTRASKRWSSSAIAAERLS
jgi:hypothetical protein